MDPDGGLPVHCAVCGVIGKYSTIPGADQMRDVHLAAAHSQDAAGGLPDVSVLEWEPNDLAP